MPLKRIMPCLLFDGNGLVKTIRFKNPKYVGDPINAIKIFNEKEVDELILIDIMASKEKRKPKFDKIADMASEAFMPFAYGGGVKTYEDFERLYKLGVEKVIVNSLIQENPKVLKEVIENYGAQAVVACIDVKTSFFGAKIPSSYLKHKMKYTLNEYINYLEHEIGVGEFMVQSIERDGTWDGYDYDVTEQIVNAVDVPVIACGGCGSANHLIKVLYGINANAAAIGSMAVYSKKGMGVLINFPSRETIIKEK